jgi:hypothetical protein
LWCAELDRQHAALFEDQGCQPLADQAQETPISDPVRQEPQQPVLADAVEECPEIGIQDSADLLPMDPDCSASSAWCWLRPRLAPMGEAEEIRLLADVQHLHHRALDDLVLQRSDVQRPLAAVGFGNVLASRRLRPIGASLHPPVQILEPALEVYVVRVSGDAVDTWRRPALQLKK